MKFFTLSIFGFFISIQSFAAYWVDGVAVKMDEVKLEKYSADSYEIEPLLEIPIVRITSGESNYAGFSKYVKKRFCGTKVNSREIVAVRFEYFANFSNERDSRGSFYCSQFSRSARKAGIPVQGERE